ncbi:MAG: hypothetical protein RIF44_18520, partial [Nitratireductor sp.]
SGELAGEICAKAYENGLVVETSGSEDQVVKILAPLTTPVALLEKGFEILLSAAETVISEKTAIQRSNRHDRERLQQDRRFRAGSRGVRRAMDVGPDAAGG